jgi:hypothetical protein
VLWFWVFGLGHKKNDPPFERIGSDGPLWFGWGGSLRTGNFEAGLEFGCGLTPFSAEQLMSECFNGGLKSGSEHLFPMVHENPPFLSCGLRVSGAKPSSSRDYTKKARGFWWGGGGVKRGRFERSEEGACFITLAGSTP